MAKRPRSALAMLIAILAIVGIAVPAFAFNPPPLDGHVVDTSGSLTPEQILAVDRKLEDVRTRTGFEIVAFVTGSLEGESREDVAYTTFNTWKIGKKGADNGVLLLIAPRERKTFIAVGKGVEGQLTDLQTDDILLEQVVPALKEGHVYEAVDHGTTAIARTLAGEAGAPRNGPTHVRGPQPPRQPMSPLTGAVIAGVLLLIIVLAIVSPGFRGMLWVIIEVFLFRGGGGGGGDGGGGSGYSGGGGSTGGGGAGEDY
jgi:uncharacterized protein